MRVATTIAYLDYIKFVVITTTTSHIKVAVTRVDNNTSLNKCTIVKRGTRRVTTYYIYNKKSTIGSIQSIATTNTSYYSIDRSNYNTTRLTSNFSLARLKISLDLPFLTYFDP
jgi:hypothetical protein